MSEAVAYGEAPLAGAATEVEPATDFGRAEARGRDWPLALAVIVPVLMAYAGAAYGAYAIARMLL